MKHVLATALAATVMFAPGTATAEPVADQLYAQRPSLFFSPEEIAVIEAMRLLALLPNAADLVGSDEAPVIPPDIRLGALLYNGPSRWTAWINGRKVTPTDLPEGFDVVSVGPRMVDLRWRGREEVLQIRLRPNQTFLGESRRIVEGILPGSSAPNLGTALAAVPAAVLPDPSTPAPAPSTTAEPAAPAAEEPAVTTPFVPASERTTRP